MIGKRGETFLICKCICILVLIYVYGLQKTVCIASAWLLLWYLVIWKIFGYQPLLGVEPVYFFDEKCQTNMMGIVVVDSLNTSEVISRIKKLAFFHTNSHMLCKVVTILGEYYWTPPNNNMNIDLHIRIDMKIFESRQDIADYGTKMMGEPFSMERPLWEIAVVNGFKKKKLVIFFKFHHSLTDGFSSINSLIGNICDDYEGVIQRLPVIPLWKKTVVGLSLPLLSLYFLLKLILTRQENNLLNNQNHSNNCTGHLCKKIKLSTLKVASKAKKATINDLLTSAILLGLKRFLNKYSNSNEEVIKVGLPVVMKEKDEKLGLRNIKMDPKVSILCLDLPLPKNISELSINFIDKVKEFTTKAKDSIEPLGMYYMGMALTVFTPFLLLRPLSLFLVGKLSFMFTNIAGCPKLLHIEGREVSDMFCFAPICEGISFTVAVASYAEHVRISCISDQLDSEQHKYLIAQLYDAVKLIN